MVCDVCAGRGWRPVPRNGGAVKCSFCGGRGELTWGAVAKQLGEHPSTLARVRQLRSKPETCRRVFDKVAKILWPRGQQEMFP